VDFIYFELINFPVFNVADIYVSVSVIAMCLLMLFVYKDEDLMVLFGRTQKKKNKEA
jgi:signal peptidase II